MTEEQLRFHLEEYKVLRSEIATYVKYEFDFFLYAVGGSGLIAAWLLSHHGELGAVTPGAERIAGFIPLLLSLLAYGAYRHLGFIIGRTARYCALVEKATASSGLGWETYLSTADRGSVALVTNLAQNGSWAVLILADLALAFLT